MSSSFNDEARRAATSSWMTDFGVITECRQRLEINPFRNGEADPHVRVAREQMQALRWQTFSDFQPHHRFRIANHGGQGGQCHAPRRHAPNLGIDVVGDDDQQFRREPARHDKAHPTVRVRRHVQLRLTGQPARQRHAHPPIGVGLHGQGARQRQTQGSRGTRFRFRIVH